jgi:hypothetical protein
MIAGLDSSTQPTAAQAQAAKASGVRLWSGYLQTQPNVGLYAPWSQQGFENARLCGSIPIAFCSGWDNPAALKGLAASWNVRLCLDVEGGIRGNGPWVQAFLDASGAGLYANPPYHGWTAPFHILAAYPRSGDPQGTWNATGPPAGPHGWQWAGSHSEFGVTVDRGDYDDWFGGLFGPGSQSLGEDDMQFIVWRNPIDGSEWELTPAVNPTAKTPIDAERAKTLDGLAKLAGLPGLTVIGNANVMLDRLPIAAAPVAPGSVDLTPALNAIGAVKTELDVVGGDVATVKRLIEKDLAP